MSCLSTTRRAEIQARLERAQARLTTLNTAYDAALEGGIESYQFDSGEGRQQTRYRSIEELQKAIDATESRINWLNRKLRGTNLVNMNLRRNPYV